MISIAGIISIEHIIIVPHFLLFEKRCFRIDWYYIFIRLSIMTLALLKQQFEKAKIIKKGSYQYIINSITEQDPALEPALLEDCASELLKKINYKEATKILTPEAMGITIATAISLKTSIPLIIATRRKKMVPDEIVVEYATGYDKGILHLNNINKDDKILIIDDLISTGGTIIALIDGIKRAKAQVADIGAIFYKIDYKGLEEIKKMGCNPKVLFNVRIDKNRVKIC
jgi:adenine phosphoribosyltransferase